LVSFFILLVQIAASFRCFALQLSTEDNWQIELPFLATGDAQLVAG